MHKWSMLNLAFQAGFIAGFFVAIFPYCAYGLPEWTCLPIIIVAPIAFCFIWPIFVHFFCTAPQNNHLEDLYKAGIAPIPTSSVKPDGITPTN